MEQLSQAEIQRRIDHWFGYVYLLQCGEHFKIGFSKRPIRRLRQVRTGSPLPVDLIHTLRTSHYRAIELQLHKRFADKRVRGEWFKLSEDDVDYVCKLDHAGREPSHSSYDPVPLIPPRRPERKYAPWVEKAAREYEQRKRARLEARAAESRYDSGERE